LGGQLDNLFALLGTAVAAAAAVITAFWKYEDVASLEAKQKVTRWLKYSGPTADHPGWADHLVTAFSKILANGTFLRNAFGDRA
jgi:predicted outer membrane lipoprotein